MSNRGKTGAKARTKTTGSSSVTASELKYIRDKAEIFYGDLRNDVRSDAPDLPTAVGKKLSRLRGTVVLNELWATWCPPCHKEIPNILDNYRKYHDADFEVIALSGDRDLPDLRDFVLKERLPWIIVADHHPQDPLSMISKFSIGSFPTFLLHERDRRVTEVPCRDDELGKALDRLLNN